MCKRIVHKLLAADTGGPDAESLSSEAGMIHMNV